MVGRGPSPRAAALAVATAANEARRCATSAAPRSGTPSAPAIVATSASTPSSVTGSTVTTRTRGPSADASARPHASSRSLSVTAQMRHWRCVITMSGRSAAIASRSSRYTGPPDALCARTCASISSEKADGSTYGAVTAGSARTSSGASHPCERPTRQCAMPSRATISVHAESRLTTRGAGERKEFEAFIAAMLRRALLVASPSSSRGHAARATGRP